MRAASVVVMLVRSPPEPDYSADKPLVQGRDYVIVTPESPAFRAPHFAYAIEKGVKGAVILDGRVSHAVLRELLTDGGAGTLIRP